ncbi:MAG TPA: NAD(P)/FAD-dependent oxidoreductase [Gammaproteobacteria bacterium]|jgi:glutathione reductase (NADPH)
MAAKRYDLVVIGTGAAATSVATQLRAAKWRVAIVDHRPFGGTCQLRGCDPKKVLRSGTAARDYAERMRGHGLVGDTRIDWPALMAFKRSFTDLVSGQKRKSYREQGIEAYRGWARFTGRNSLDLGGTAVEAEHMVLATGAEPVKLRIPGEEYLLDNQGFMALEHLPKRIVMVGGGYIAAEFSHIAARTGAQVTVLQQGKQMLTQFEPELVAWLMGSFEALGIDVRTGTSVESIEKAGDAFKVHASSSGKQRSFAADLVVHAAGRKPDFAPLDLAAADIALEKGKLKLNGYLQSVSNKAVYAAGDAAQAGPPLTPVAGVDAAVVAANLLTGNRQKPDYAAVPSVAFTLPPIASVGLSEETARSQGKKFRVNCRRAADWFTAKQEAEPVYGYKILIQERTGKILGAHLVGPHVDEVINVFAFAIRHGHTAQELKDTVFAYPTGASDIASML